MIQFNLLPNVKLEYIKARRLNRATILIAGSIGAGALTLLIILFLGVSVFQKKYLNDLSKDIASDSKKLQQVENLNNILTVQNQLNTLTGLHERKPAATRLFTYLQKLTPSDVAIETLNIDFTAGTLTIAGTAPRLSAVNSYVDTIKYTKYNLKQEDGTQTTAPAFSEVVLSSFDRDEKGAGYTVGLKFDPVIFQGTMTPELVLPTNADISAKSPFSASTTGGGQ